MNPFVRIFPFLAPGLSAFAADSGLVARLSDAVAPPPAAPIFQTGSTASTLRAASTFYSIGDPTPEEQLYLEMINRARLNPPGEGVLLANIKDPEIVADYQEFRIDLNLLQSQFAVIAATQPLAFSARLSVAARAHSQDMFDNVFQDHTGSDGSTPASRITGAGFVGSAAENVYSNAKSVAHGHAAFEVDWGGPPENGGMQSPSGHRESIHNPIFREVGIGVTLGNNEVPGKVPIHQVGPQVVTQDFGVAQNSTPFITGVAYYDLNGNSFYDIGEGIGNVTVTVTGASFQAVTARSGAYAIPVTGNGNYTVTFSGPGFANLVRTVSVVGSKNQKIDFTPPYTPPVVSGPVVAAVQRSNNYFISPVGGASAYQWRSFQKVPAVTEGAENDSARLTITQSGTYDVIEGIIVKSGSFAFHLVTPTDDARSQYITLSPTYLINNNSSLTFQSQLGFSTPDQHAQVQISTDNGANWTAVYNQDGNSDHPETAWTQRSVNLSSYSGKAVHIRFAFEFLRGMYVSATDLSVDWLFDDIQFFNTQEIVNEQITDAIGTTFQFVPSIVSDFSLQARAKTGHDFLDWGPPFPVHSGLASGTPDLHLNFTRIAGGQFQLDAAVDSGATPSSLVLESRDSLSKGWQTDPAIVQAISTTQFRAVLAPPNAAGAKFYRLRAN